MATYTRPPNDPHDWAAISRWEDAGRPPINPDGTPQNSTDHDTPKDS